MLYHVLARSYSHVVVLSAVKKGQEGDLRESFRRTICLHFTCSFFCNDVITLDSRVIYEIKFCSS